MGNLPEKEFRVMIVNMIQDLGEKMEAQRSYKKCFKKSQKTSKTSKLRWIAKYLK